MTKNSKLFALSLVAITVAAIVLWVVWGGSIAEPEGPAASDRLISAPLERTQAAANTIAEPAAADSSQPVSSEVDEPIDAGAELRRQRMADSIYFVLGAPIVQTLSDSGLAQSDSEAIARRFATDMSGCVDDTFVNEAARQSISVDALFVSLQSALDFGDINLSDVPMPDVIASVSEVMDIGGMEANLMPCMVGAVQAAGIPPESVAEIMNGQMGLDFPFNAGNAR